jgi:NAD(P)-dependent dehydrogenase (short-subunit alcohol dehydrogenase family)
MPSAITPQSERGGGSAVGTTANLADRSQVADVAKQLGSEHQDSTLLVNAAGFFIPKTFLDYDDAAYDSYHELNYAAFFLTQAVVEGMIATGSGVAIVNIGRMWAHQAVAATPSSAYSMAKAGLHASPTTWRLSLPSTRSASTLSHLLWSRPPLRGVRPQGQAGGDDRELRSLPSDRSCRAGRRRRGRHLVPALR